jgi:hypothetical protein
MSNSTGINSLQTSSNVVINNNSIDAQNFKGSELCLQIAKIATIAAALVILTGFTFIFMAQAMPYMMFFYFENTIANLGYLSFALLSTAGINSLVAGGLYVYEKLNNKN